MVLDIPTPPKCIADFCLIPMGIGASVSSQITDVQRLMAKSGLSYTMHSAGTTVGATPGFLDLALLFQNHKLDGDLYSKGPWDDVMKVIGQAHSLLHEKGVVRIQTDIRVGSRTDKMQSFTDKVSAVEKLLAADSKE